jgi:hypothetical protein
LETKVFKTLTKYVAFANEALAALLPKGISSSPKARVKEGLRKR